MFSVKNFMLVYAMHIYGSSDVLNAKMIYCHIVIAQLLASHSYIYRYLYGVISISPN